MQGKIIRGIGGFYYVHTGEDSGIYECRAKGIFRKDNRKPLVGDDVELDVLDGANRLGNIRQILPRRSELIRPAAANVDQALIIFSVVSPRPSFNLLDRFLIMMGQRHIPCVICFNKLDLDARGEGEGFCGIYGGCGYQTAAVSARTGEGIEELRRLLRGRTTAVAGPSGVGKSSIINCLQTEIHMETGQISEKIQRGRHTTRHTELIAAGDGTYILDTPGFSSLEVFDLEKEELAAYYGEFAAYERYCRFGGCAHIREPVCGVRDAVERGAVSRIRYENYCQIYEELKDKRKQTDSGRRQK